MEKTLSVIALVFAVSLAACQPKPSENAPAPSPVIESPIQQTEATPTPPLATGPTSVSVPEKRVAPKKASKTGAQSKTATPRLDALEKRVKRIEDTARQYGFNL